MVLEKWWILVTVGVLEQIPQIKREILTGSKYRSAPNSLENNVPGSLLFFAVLGFELRAYTLSHSTTLFCDAFFLDRVSQTICLGWLLQS
jgi:hypothetical protein